MISFVFHFLKQIWRADRGTIVFDSWVDIISNGHPIQKLSRATLKMQLWKGIENWGFNSIQNFFRANVTVNGKTYANALPFNGKFRLVSVYYLFKTVHANRLNGKLVRFK